MPTQRKAGKRAPCQVKRSRSGESSTILKAQAIADGFELTGIADHR